MKIIQMPENVCVNQIEPVDNGTYDNKKLEIFVVGLVQIIYTAVRIRSITFQLRGAATDAEQILIFKCLHVGIVIIYEITHTSKSTIDDRQFPCLTIIYLSCSWQ